MDHIYRILKNYGDISKRGANAITGIPGIIELLNSENLPENYRTRPEPPSYDTFRPSTGNKSQGDYREKMTYYLEPWIKLDALISWPNLEILADFCESKARNY